MRFKKTPVSFPRDIGIEKSDLLRIAEKDTHCMPR